MSDHYYSQSPTSATQLREITIRARGMTRTVWTDNGVFSKQGLDYGTRLLVETVELPEEGTVVDLGCGYGAVTALLAPLYPKLAFLMLDVNERAVALAVKNTQFAADRVRAYVSDGFAAVPEAAADAILLNPPIRAGKQVVYRLFDEAADHLNAAGALWVVIHKKHGAESARRHLEGRYEVTLVERAAGYHIFRCVRIERLS
ncbi:methyltransferase [Alicyclobacillus cycloheptanicus]|uniref:16S rRNA (Guanine1207-N2)-methyltransferase n=1 Tax=Alicyclobacillus cycloheptanicus TaxID=1457 RepID=A0ABT9XJD7_9BACL|nr:methyltransferase [Alicyclobacillus cycloheptanicus]MDQ0190395.1 16S rRNA (guanine1207-N2)-methyltransferase [Alicyclobacillus cycloheptanicus]WDM02635.1 methyltransferase [Alicyclobacillus cycloheptanicus]